MGREERLSNNDGPLDDNNLCFDDKRDTTTHGLAHKYPSVVDSDGEHECTVIVAIAIYLIPNPKKAARVLAPSTKTKTTTKLLPPNYNTSDSRNSESNCAKSLNYFFSQP
jgi:hypothetical protein